MGRRAGLNDKPASAGPEIHYVPMSRLLNMGVSEVAEPPGIAMTIVQTVVVAASPRDE